MNDKDILERLEKERNKDPFFSGGKIISSMSTAPPEVALEAYKIFSDINALDTYLFSSAEKLETEVIRWMGSLYKNPSTSGYISTGGTESNMAALYAAKKIYPERNEVIIPQSAHYSLDKAADIMGLKVVRTKIDENFRADASDIEKKINDDTLAVIATVGTSSLGMIDPIEEINDLCDDVFFHIDAAFGGFMIPFIGPFNINFELENIDSISVDPHKMGGAPIPSGIILFKEKDYEQKLARKPTYIPVETFTVSGSRSGGAIAATWATIMHYGKEGFHKRVSECIKNTAYFCSEIGKIDGAEIVAKPDLNIAGLRIRDINISAEKLEACGWKMAVNSELECIRFAVMPHVTKEKIDGFISDLKKIIKK